MRTASVVSEPEIEDDEVVLRLVVEDSVMGPGGVFVCRMKSYDSIAVETFPRGQTPPAEGELRAEAASLAQRHALGNREQFDPLFAQLRARE